MEQVILCPYCGSHAHKKSSEIIYGRDFGMAFICDNFPTCNSYVGCHLDGRPMGTLANAELRKARNDAHKIFDPIWKSKVIKKRWHAYGWLADKMNLTRDNTHIGMFNLNQCIQVINICKKFLLTTCENDVNVIKNIIPDFDYFIYNYK